MSDFASYQEQQKFIGETLCQIRNSLPDDDKPLMHGIIGTYTHMAPEIVRNIWGKLYYCMLDNFKDVKGVHCKTVEIYNTRYDEFKNRW